MRVYGSYIISRGWKRNPRRGEEIAKYFSDARLRSDLLRFLFWAGPGGGLGANDRGEGWAQWRREERIVGDG
jgi:hypothetical protein